MDNSRHKFLTLKRSLDLKFHQFLHHQLFILQNFNQKVLLRKCKSQNELTSVVKFLQKFINQPKKGRTIGLVACGYKCQECQLIMQTYVQYVKYLIANFQIEPKKNLLICFSLCLPIFMKSTDTKKQIVKRLNKPINKTIVIQQNQDLARISDINIQQIGDFIIQDCQKQTEFAVIYAVMTIICKIPKNIKIRQTQSWKIDITVGKKDQQSKQKIQIWFIVSQIIDGYKFYHCLASTLRFQKIVQFPQILNICHWKEHKKYLEQFLQTNESQLDDAAFKQFEKFGLFSINKQFGLQKSYNKKRKGAELLSDNPLRYPIQVCYVWGKKQGGWEGQQIQGKKQLQIINEQLVEQQESILIGEQAAINQKIQQKTQKLQMKKEQYKSGFKSVRKQYQIENRQKSKKLKQTLKMKKEQKANKQLARQHINWKREQKSKLNLRQWLFNKKVKKNPKLIIFESRNYPKIVTPMKSSRIMYRQYILLENCRFLDEEIKEGNYVLVVVNKQDKINFNFMLLEKKDVIVIFYDPFNQYILQKDIFQYFKKIPIFYGFTHGYINSYVKYCLNHLKEALNLDKLVEIQQQIKNQELRDRLKKSSRQGSLDKTPIEMTSRFRNSKQKTETSQQL